MHEYSFHEKGITKVAYSKSKEGIFASADSEGKILLWDSKRVGEEVVNADTHDGPPEMIVTFLLKIIKSFNIPDTRVE
jgi:histone-binding protein RBBP4